MNCKFRFTVPPIDIHGLKITNQNAEAGLRDVAELEQAIEVVRAVGGKLRTSHEAIAALKKQVTAGRQELEMAKLQVEMLTQDKVRAAAATAELQLKNSQLKTELRRTCGSFHDLIACLERETATLHATVAEQDKRVRQLESENAALREDLVLVRIKAGHVGGINGIGVRGAAVGGHGDEQAVPSFAMFATTAERASEHDLLAASESKAMRKRRREILSLRRSLSKRKREAAITMAVELDSREALLRALDKTRPWNVMFAKRPGFAHSFAFASLKPQAKRWVEDAIVHLFQHRRAYWECQHWLPHQPDSTSGVLRMDTTRRSNRAEEATAAWQVLQEELAQLVEDKLLPKHVPLEPFLWTLPVRPVWTPQWVKRLEDLEYLDASDPGRCYHVSCLERHPFYVKKLDAKFPNKHTLPDMEGIKARRGLAMV